MVAEEESGVVDVDEGDEGHGEGLLAGELLLLLDQPPQPRLLLYEEVQTRHPTHARQTQAPAAPRTGHCTENQ